jgi:hypothetical protein
LAGIEPIPYQPSTLIAMTPRQAYLFTTQTNQNPIDLFQKGWLNNFRQRGAFETTSIGWYFKGNAKISFS